MNKVSAHIVFLLLILLTCICYQDVEQVDTDKIVNTTALGIAEFEMIAIM